MADQIPSRVAALAAQIGDEPIAWKEHDDGSIVIVFNSKGKQTFDKTFEIETPADVTPDLIPAVDVGAERVPPSPVDVKPKSKRKEKSNATSQP